MAFCSNCGKPLPAGAWTCASCGHSVGGAYAGQQAVRPTGRRLIRPRLGRKIAGMCQGLANYYGWDVTVIRVIAVLLALFSGIGAIGYVVIWILAPEEPYALQPGAGYPPLR